MAKDRQDFKDAPATQAAAKDAPASPALTAPAIAPPAPAADETDKAALAKRVMELEAELAQLRPAAAPALPPGEIRHWKVDIQGAPTLIVEAATSAEAYEVYKHVLGVINSEYVPSVVLVSADEYQKQQSERVRNVMPRAIGLPEDAPPHMIAEKLRARKVA